MKIIVLHEYGARKHFAGLVALEKQGVLHIDWIEFNIFTQLGRILLRKRKASVPGLMRNVQGLARLLMTRNQKVIVGAAPYDPAIIYLSALKKRHRLIYFTSWPMWDGTHFAKKPVCQRFKSIWAEFLDGIRAVGVSKSAVKAISPYVLEAVHIPHAVDVTVFHPDENTAERHAKPIVLYAGQFTKRKGMELLLSIVRKQELDVDYWFAGWGPCQDEIIDLHQKRLLRYWGYIDQEEKLAEIIRNCDMLVLPSIDDLHHGQVENFGIILIEAMASGIPVIATDCIGPAEIVQDGVTGLLVPQNNRDALRNAIEYLAQNPGVRREMGRKACEVCKDNYSLGVVKEKWENMLERAGFYGTGK